MSISFPFLDCMLRNTRKLCFYRSQHILAFDKVAARQNGWQFALCIRRWIFLSSSSCLCPFNCSMICTIHTSPLADVDEEPHDWKTTQHVNKMYVFIYRDVEKVVWRWNHGKWYNRKTTIKINYGKHFFALVLRETLHANNQFNISLQTWKTYSNEGYYLCLNCIYWKRRCIFHLREVVHKS